MKTLVLANQKGGVGKTSTLVHIAFYLANQGKKIGVIDLDTQENASYTLSEFSIDIPASSFILAPEKHDSLNLEKTRCTAAYNKWRSSKKFDVLQLEGKGASEEAIQKYFATEVWPDYYHNKNILLIPADPNLLKVESYEIKEIANNIRLLIDSLSHSGFDYILIDTAPALGIRLSAALSVADFVLSPIELEVYSLQGIKKMVTTIVNLRDEYNPNLNFLGMLPSRVDNRNPRHKKHLSELKTTYPTLIVPCSIALRSSVADALATKKAVWDVKKTAARPAANEMKSMAAYILKKMEGK